MKNQKLTENLLFVAFLLQLIALCPILGLLRGWVLVAALVVWAVCGYFLVKRMNEVFPEEEV